MRKKLSVWDTAGKCSLHPSLFIVNFEPCDLLILKIKYKQVKSRNQLQEEKALTLCAPLLPRIS